MFQIFRVLLKFCLNNRLNHLIYSPVIILSLVFSLVFPWGIYLNVFIGLITLFQLILIDFCKFLFFLVINVQILDFNYVSLIEFLVNSRMVFRNYVLYDTIDLKSLFLHFLMMWSALIMCSRLNKVWHHFEYTTKTFFLVLCCEFFLKVGKEYDIFEFFFLSPMTLFLISNVIFDWGSVNYKR